MNRRELLAYARRSGLRDVAPANIELGPAGVLYVTDADDLDGYDRRYRNWRNAIERIALPRHNPSSKPRREPAGGAA